MRLRLGLLAALVVATAAAPPASAAVDVQSVGLQVALQSKGLYRGAIDGIAGPLTDQAVRRFQERRGLVVDGVVGPQTRAALGRLGRPLYGTRPLRQRLVGWDVAVLQFLLERNGSSAGAIDGAFGPLTDAAVRSLQQSRGLAVDGIVGPVTRQALSSASPSSVAGTLDYWADQYGIDRSLVRALAWMESGHQPQVVSDAGARGVMQVTPTTRRYVEAFLLGEQVPHTVEGNIRIGVAFLHQQLHAFGFDVRRALAAYYQGPSAVRQFGLYPESRRFVRTILALRQQM